MSEAAATTPVGRDDGTAGPLSATYRLVTVAIIGMVTVVAFEALAVSTAMPVVAQDLDAVRSYGLAFSLFLTMSLLGTVLAGGWCDARGPLWPVVCGLTLFAGGLVVSGAAHTFSMLLAGRVVSGVGGGLMIVSLYVVVAAVYPDSLRPKVFGWISAAWVLPSVVGPTLAGWLATEVSWRWVFLGVAPLVLGVAAAMLPRLVGMGSLAPVPTTRRGNRRRALAGVGLAGGAAALQWGAQELDPPTGWSLTAIVVGSIVLAVCLPQLVPSGTLRARRGLPAVIAVRGLLAACFFGAETFVPLMLVNERGLAPALAGVALTGGVVGWFAGSWLQARSGLRVGRHRLVSGGAVLVAAAVALLPVAVLPGVPAMVVLPIWLLAGFGMGAGLSTTSVLVLSLSDPGQEGRNSAALQVSDALGSVVGIGAAGAVFAGLHTRAGDDGYVFVLIWLALAVLGIAAAWVGQRCRPAAR